MPRSCTVRLSYSRCWPEDTICCNAAPFTRPRRARAGAIKWGQPGSSRGRPCARRSIESGVAAVEVSFQPAKGGEAVLACELRAGLQPFVKTTAGANTGKLRVEAPCRLGILPDFFADDMVLDATAVPTDRTEVPSENFFLQMVGGGDGIVMTVWDKAEEDVELLLAGQEKDRVIRAVEVAYAKGSIWVAVLAEKGIWGSADITPENAGKVVDMNWPVPFKAKWKGNLTRSDRTADGWEFMDHPGNRSMWATAIHRYNYPCWFDGPPGSLIPHVQTLNASYRGPAVAYPIDRVKDTPLDRFTAQDLMRNCLGVGPCEYIIDLAGQSVGNKGLYTCGAYDRLVPIFGLGRQKDERPLVEQTLREVTEFVLAIRARILDYVKFGDDMMAYLGEQKKAHPELADFITKMEGLTKEVRARYERKRGCTQVGVVKLCDQLRASFMQDVPKVSGQQIMGTIRDGIGAPQDDLVAECRMAAKVLRQSAAMEMALNPKTAPVAAEIRRRTRAMLRSKYGHEGR